MGEPSEGPGPGGAPLPQRIALRGLVKHFGPRAALCGIDLDLTGPQIVGIVGPDGAGKTTLLRSIAGLLEIEARTADVLGFDLRQDVTHLKEHIGYVPQVFSLYRDLTIRENLSVTGRLHGLSTAELWQRAEPLLERNGLAPFLDRQAGALSGGMKQKLAIASALVPRPRLLILDEPTAGVDVVARDEIWATLTARKHEVLILISTSYLDEIEACDRLVYLDEGKVIATGSPAELRAQVPLELFRAWGAEPRAIARAARALPYVDGARATGRFARIEVRAAQSPGVERVLRDLRALPAVQVLIAEPTALDMESTLLALTRHRTEVGSP